MKTNVGRLDCGVRVFMGLAQAGLLFLLNGNVRGIGLIGLVPLMTGISGSCPMYHLLGMNTCPLQKK